MTFIAASLIAGGSAILGGAIAAGGSRSAAKTQAASAREAAALQKEQFDQQMALQEPYRQAGLTGQNRLMTLLGLGNAPPAEGSYGIMGPPPQPIGAGGDASSADFGKYARDFSMADYQQDPGYLFRLSEGMRALQRNAGARGGLISGQTMKGMQDYAQNAASGEYQNAFNRYQINRQNQLQPLSNLMSSGQAAASNQAGQAGQYGVNAGNMINQAGQSIAAGQMGMANSMGNAISSAGSMYQNQTNFNNYLRQQQYPNFNPYLPGGVGERPY
jgi:hypothetical protein